MNNRFVRNSDPGTSKAAEVASREFRSGHEKAILDALVDNPFSTAGEIGNECGLTSVQVNRRIRKLIDDGQVSIEGARRCRAGGNKCRFFTVVLNND